MTYIRAVLQIAVITILWLPLDIFRWAARHTRSTRPMGKDLPWRTKEMGFHEVSRGKLV